MATLRLAGPALAEHGLARPSSSASGSAGGDGQAAPAPDSIERHHLREVAGAMARLEATPDQAAELAFRVADSLVWLLAGRQSRRLAEAVSMRRQAVALLAARYLSMAPPPAASEVGGASLTDDRHQPAEHPVARDHKPTIEVGALVVDFSAQRASIGGRDLGLSGRELLLLYELARHTGGLVDRDYLFREVWDRDNCDSKTLDVHISRLRRKLDEAGGYGALLKTVRNRGYLLSTEVERIPQRWRKP